MATRAETSRELPVFPLRVVLTPGAPLPLRIFEPRYLDMVSRCLRRDEPFVVVLALPDPAHAADAALSRCAVIGTTARIVDFGRAQDGLLTLRTVGEARVRIGALRRESGGLHIAPVTPLPVDAGARLMPEDAPLVAVLRQLLPDDDADHRGLPRRWDDADWVSLRAAELLPLELIQRQRLLECDDARERLDQCLPIAAALTPTA